MNVKTWRETCSSLNQIPSHLAVNVLSKIKFYHLRKNNFISFWYTCTYVGDHQGSKMYSWNTTISDHCCLGCDGRVHKADSVIKEIPHEDECLSIETSVCRRIPGKYCQSHVLVRYIYMYKYLGEEKAKIEVEYTFRNCCNDGAGLQPLKTVLYQPSTCSQRTCYYDKMMPHSVWISQQVACFIYLFFILFFLICCHRSLTAVTAAWWIKTK